MRRSETKTAINRATMSVDSILSIATIYGQSSDEIHDKVHRTLAGMFSGKVPPPWARAYVVGYYHNGRQELYRQHLFFARVSPDGTLYEDHGRYGCSSCEDLYGSTDNGWTKWPTGHFWIPSKEFPLRGVKPFNPPMPPDEYPPQRVDLIHGVLTPEPRRPSRPVATTEGVRL